MKITLIIVGAILLILLILLFSPIRVYVEYLGGKPKVLLKYLFIKKLLAGGEKKPQKEKPKKKPKKKKAEEQETPEKKKSGLLPDTVGGKTDFILELVKAGGRALRRLLRRIRIRDIFIDFTVSDEDAYECAVKFGKMNIIVYNALTVLGYFLRLKKKSINIKCVYNRPKCIYDTSFKVCVSPGVLIAIALGFGWAFLKLVIKNKKQAKLKEKQQEHKEDNKDKEKQAAY